MYLQHLDDDEHGKKMAMKDKCWALCWLAIQQLLTVKTKQKQRLEEIRQKKEEEPELFYLAPKQSHHVALSLFVKFPFFFSCENNKKNKKPYRQLCDR